MCFLPSKQLLHLTEVLPPFEMNLWKAIWASLLINRCFVCWFSIGSKLSAWPRDEVTLWKSSLSEGSALENTSGELNFTNEILPWSAALHCFQLQTRSIRKAQGSMDRSKECIDSTGRWEVGSKICCNAGEFLRKWTTDMGRIMPLALLRCLSLPKASVVNLQNEVNPLQGKTNGKDGKCWWTQGCLIRLY